MEQSYINQSKVLKDMFASLRICYKSELQVCVYFSACSLTSYSGFSNIHFSVTHLMEQHLHYILGSPIVHRWSKSNSEPWELEKKAPGFCFFTPMVDKGDRGDKVPESWALILLTVIRKVRPSFWSRGLKPSMLALFRDTYILFFTCITIKQRLLIKF